MRYTAIIFDLFGTLVPDFAPSRHDDVYARMAREVGVPYEAFRRGFSGTFNQRTTGRFATIAENVRHVCEELGAEATPEALDAAALYRHAFTRASIIPADDVTGALAGLRRSGFRIGLLTNCGPDVPELWDGSPLAPYIDTAVFSCDERMRKPAPELYAIACARLGADPGECVYVGDGSDEELSGARGAGLTPVLRRSDLRDVYDPDRSDVTSWRGETIDSIGQLAETIARLERGRG